MPSKSTSHHIGWLATLAIVFVTLLIRLPWLDGLGLHGDEDISTLAARGIVETGVPRLPSGALYLRAPLYSYLVAPLVATGVDWVPRLLSVLASVLTAVVVVRVGRQLVGERAALLGGIFYAISLTEIVVARTTRMYALYELLALVAVGLLYRFWQSGTLRSGLCAAGAVAAALTAHTLGATLWILGLVVIVRDFPWRTRAFAVAATLFFASLVKAVRALEHTAIHAGGSGVAEPPMSAAEAAVPVTLRAAIADDPFSFGTRILGGAGFTAIVLLLLAIGIAIATRGSRDATRPQRVIAALGIGFTLAAAGAHLIGLALISCCVLVLLRRELYAYAAGRSTLAATIVLTGVAGIVWTLAASLSGHDVADGLLAFTRWPARLTRLFLWPPALALMALPGAIAILVRSWTGRATNGERFLMLALLLVATSRGLLTGRTHARYLVELWPLWGLLAAWSVLGAVQWLRGRFDSVAGQRTAVTSVGLVALLAALLLPGTGPRSTLSFLRLKPGDAATTGFGSTFSVADIGDAARWLAPRLQPDERVVATDWLTTYCYLGRVDGWSRWQDWGKQSRRREGVVREIYLGAEVLPDLDALTSYVERGPTWILAGGGELATPNTRLHPDVRAWLLAREPSYVARDGETRVYRIVPDKP